MGTAHRFGPTHPGRGTPLQSNMHQSQLPACKALSCSVNPSTGQRLAAPRTATTYLLATGVGDAVEEHLVPTFSGLALGAAGAQAVPWGRAEQGEPGGLDGEKARQALGKPWSGSSFRRVSACSLVLWCSDLSERVALNRRSAAGMLAWYLW